MKLEPDLNCPNHYEELTVEQQRILQDWIYVNFETSERFHLINASNNLKNLFENSPEGFYITNGQFKGAMINAGYKVKDETERNWCFNVSKRSVKVLREKVYPK
ncbi:hypothetical protein [Gracilibacillus alcaliphilus]|uniref:hypothetical protein n=1 Tax=Gracilibacillus alcaliphilus TaxID=1401441 RepID=UPI00195692F4|nr:hypothetical protein [Gracilibacillus alcaliphilus]MBM7679562.1 hypothetical protein [Gracilibacillus alcaliphilus]